MGEPGQAAGFLSGLEPSSVVLALLSVTVAVIVGMLAKRAVVKALGKVDGIAPAIRVGIARTVRLTTILLGVGTALAFLGAPLQPIVGLSLIAAAVIVIALRGVSENFAAGAVIQTRRPFVVGHTLTVGEHSGTVVEINGRSVHLRTLDGRVVHIPNRELLSSVFVNESSTGRLRASVRARLRRTDGAGIDTVRQLLMDACASVPLLQPDGITALLVHATAGELTFDVRFWHGPDDGPNAAAGAVEAIAALGDTVVEVSSFVPTAVSISRR
ncbi:mechanosensitive ion channel family protein [Leifsonia sp. NPDC056665]|uniref:mechanosensitive ion channel family protein n=1 Tax=Leifsonia sp. NPDC056665 TaxID=3345901 RepID=UPI0036929B63